MVEEATMLEKAIGAHVREDATARRLAKIRSARRAPDRTLHRRTTSIVTGSIKSPALINSISGDMDDKPHVSTKLACPPVAVHIGSSCPGRSPARQSAFWPSVLSSAFRRSLRPML